MNRDEAMDILKERLDGKKIIWVGPRGEDAESLRDLNIPVSYYTGYAPLPGEFSMETDSNVRVFYSLDEDISNAAKEMLSKVKEDASNTEAVLLTYKSSQKLHDLCQSVNVPCLSTAPDPILDSKTYVEQQLEDRFGVRTLGYSRETGVKDVQALATMIDEYGEIVARADSSSLGRGLWRISSLDDLKAIPAETKDLCTFAPCLEPSIPLNVSACVSAEGDCSLHTLSLQLIGHPLLTTRSFGYCGNDFASARELPVETIEQCGTITKNVARWLADREYKGAFGIDLLCYKDNVHFVEINPRFQGSSKISAQIDKAAGRVDIYTSHLLAWNGVEHNTSIPEFVEQTKNQKKCAHMVFYNQQNYPIRLESVPESSLQRWRFGSGVAGRSWELGLQPDPVVQIMPNATLIRVEVPHKVTDDGRTFDDMTEARVASVFSELQYSRAKRRSTKPRKRASLKLDSCHYC